jgi:hypothetical protein
MDESDATLTDGKILATGSSNPTARKVLGQDVKTLKDPTGELYGPDLYAAAKEGQIAEARRGRDARCEDKLRDQGRRSRLRRRLLQVDHSHQISGTRKYSAHVQNMG